MRGYLAKCFQVDHAACLLTEVFTKRGDVELFIPLLHPNKRARPSARPDPPDARPSPIASPGQQDGSAEPVGSVQGAHV